jgi:hypothetical protein
MADVYLDQLQRRRRRANALIASGASALFVCIGWLVWGHPLSSGAGVALVDTAVATSTWKSETGSTALPPDGIPLARTFDTLKSHADAGDADSALRLFHELQRCRYTAWANQQVASNAKNALTQNVSGLSGTELDNREKQLGAMQTLLDQARKNQPLCEGTSARQLKQIVPVTQRAAQLGDDRAAECYVNGLYLMQDGGVEHPDWMTDYKQNAISVSDQAIARGNWTMVAAVADAYGAQTASRAFSRVTGQSPAMAYRYLKLETLGALPQDAEYFQHALDEASRGLDSEVIAVENAWAQDTYRRYFVGQADSHPVRNLALCE